MRKTRRRCDLAAVLLTPRATTDIAAARAQAAAISPPQRSLARHRDLAQIRWCLAIHISPLCMVTTRRMLNSKAVHIGGYRIQRNG